MSGPGDPIDQPDQFPPGRNPQEPRRPPHDRGGVDPNQMPPISGASRAGIPIGSPSPAVVGGRSPGLLLSEVVSGAIWATFSFVIIYWICQLFDLDEGTWTVVGLWILSGLVVLWPGTDGLLASVLMRVRRPTLVEHRRLLPSWNAAARQAAAASPRYTLWIDDSDNVSAVVTGGYTIAVTHWALYTLPPSHLEAVLAREFMTHPGGRTWPSRLALWYSVPARLVALAATSLLKLSRTVPAVGCTLVGFLLVSYLGLILVALVFYDSLLVPFLYLMPLLSPLLFIGLRRWNERLADRGAADLGYGQRLIEVLYGWQAQQQGQGSSRQVVGGQFDWLGGSQSVSERIRALEVYEQRLRERR
jgi:Zn-dependent protease with chaperone function